MDFLENLKKTAEEFRKTGSKIVRVIGNADCDGVAATAIILKALQKENKKFVSSITNQVDERLLEELKKEPYKTYFFIDFGSRDIKLIENHLKDREIFVLDHHFPGDAVNSSVKHCNPYLHGMDGTHEISASGICYLFAKEINHENSSLAYLAVIGAIGDNQEKDGFEGLNNTILEEAVQNGKISVTKGVKMFGANTKPLHKTLEYSTNPYIPGITGNESGAKKFLKESGITDDSLKLNDLDEEQLKKLVTAILVKRMGSEDELENMFGNVYTLNNEPEESLTRDAKEFSSLLNSCCRMNHSSLGISLCLGSEEARRKAAVLMHQYRKELINGLEWFYKNKSNPKFVVEGKGYVIIRAEETIRDEIIGPFVSTIGKSNLYINGTIIMATSNTLGDETKISCRISGFKDRSIDLGDLMKEIIKKVGQGNCGGHKLAAGAVIPTEAEKKFIETAQQIMTKKGSEETIN